MFFFAREKGGLGERGQRQDQGLVRIQMKMRAQAMRKKRKRNRS